MRSEKRRVQRIELDRPIEAVLNKHVVRIIDMSTTGVRVEHTGPLGGRKKVELRFEAEGSELRVSCELVRSRLQRSVASPESIVYSSGMRFVDPAEPSRAVIRTFVARLVQRRRLRNEQGSRRDGSAAVAV